MTSADIVTYSRYGPTGEVSYSKVTVTPKEYPNRDKTFTSDPGPSFGTFTKAGLNHNLPEKFCGYASSFEIETPFCGEDTSVDSISIDIFNLSTSENLVLRWAGWFDAINPKQPAKREIRIKNLIIKQFQIICSDSNRSV